MRALKLKTKVPITSKLSKLKTQKKRCFSLCNLEETIIKINFPGDIDKLEQKDTHFLKYNKIYELKYVCSIY